MPVASRMYYTLVASLPVLPPRFEVERPPISRPRLDERLKMLHPDDAKVIEQANAFMSWDRQPVNRTDEEMVASYERLMQEISNTTLRGVIQTRLDMRTIVCAISRRRAGLPPPIGVGQWVGHIRRHFGEPEFNLSGRYPWIGPFERALDEGNATEAERLMFASNYRTWNREAQQFTFSFEVVILYLARWEVIDRWTSRNAATGKRRFETMLGETLGAYAQLYT